MEDERQPALLPANTYCCRNRNSHRVKETLFVKKKLLVFDPMSRFDDVTGLLAKERYLEYRISTAISSAFILAQRLGQLCVFT